MRKRGLLWLALVLCVCLPMMGAKCSGPTPEAEDNIEKGADLAGGAAKAAAPFLPPPFNLIALLVVGTAEAITAGVAYRRKKRAVTAEGNAKYEAEMNYRKERAIQAFGDMIDTLRESDDAETKKKVEAMLALIDSYKRKADAIASEAFAVFDKARERIG